VRAEPAVLILCLSSPSCQCADRHILTLAVRFLYRTNVQVSLEIYVFSNARALANFLELRIGEVRRISIPRTTVNKGKKEDWGAPCPPSWQCFYTSLPTIAHPRLHGTNRLCTP